MALITKYGSFWGQIPQTTGRYFWVAPSDQYTVEGVALPASNDNDGLSPERAVRTIAYAVSLASASVNDIIVLLPGAHSYATTVTINKAGLTIVGIPGAARGVQARRNGGSKKLRTSVTCTATAGICFTVSAPDVEIAYIHFIPVAAGGRGISLTPTLATANRPYIHDCTFALQGTASVTTYGITIPANVTADVLDEGLISHCYFVSGTDTSSGANGAAISVLGTAHGLTIENSTFELKGTAAWADAILSSNAGTLGLAIRDCDFINPTSATTVITTAINTTGQTVDGSTKVARCYVDAGTDGVTATAMADIVLSQSFTANTSGGTILLNG